MADSKKEKSVFVVTFPLKTEKWQEDRINKMMRLLTVFYNEKQKALLERWLHISNSAEYKEHKEEKGKTSLMAYMRDFGFSEFGFKEFFKDKNQTDSPYITHGLNSAILRNLAKSAWSAWSKKLEEKNKNIFIRIDKDVSIIKSDFKSSNNKISGFDVNYEDYSITMFASKPHLHTMFTIPFEVNRNSEYELFALSEIQNDPTKLRNLAIVRKEVRGRYKYYVQLSIAGKPYNKGRQLGSGVVGIDPGPSKITVVSDTAVRIIPLAGSIERDERETRRLQRKLDRSRRAMNPDKYNEDGTISKGKHEWVKSHHYEGTRRILADRQRKLAAKRKLAHNELANELLQMGNEFHVENNSFRSMQARTKETTKNANGKNRTKKRFGKSLANRAPSEFLTIFENKVKQYENGVYVDIPDSTACTQYDFTSGHFSAHELRERTITTSDGIRHDRDALAAFNMKFVRTEKVIGKKKVKKAVDNFNNESMAEFYPLFCQMEYKE